MNYVATKSYNALVLMDIMTYSACQAPVKRYGARNPRTKFKNREGRFFFRPSSDYPVPKSPVFPTSKTNAIGFCQPGESPGVDLPVLSGSCRIGEVDAGRRVLIFRPVSCTTRQQPTLVSGSCVRCAASSLGGGSACLIHLAPEKKKLIRYKFIPFCSE